MGVKERISVQVGETVNDKTVSCWLETDKRVPMSDRQSETITEKGQVKTMDLEVNEICK